MATVVFKPMKGAWKGAIFNSVEFDEGMVWFKVDKRDAKEQLHFSLTSVEAYTLTRDLVRVMFESKSNFTAMLKEHFEKLSQPSATKGM